MKEYASTTGTELPDQSHEIVDMDMDLIIESRTNPRTTFDIDYLNELAATIKPAGRVLQAITLRPLPSSRLEETSGMRPRPTHEIVFGACRYRSSRIAGLKTIRSTIEDLTDDQVLIIQLVENLKRKDLTELEEAEGYRRLMTESGMSVDAIATEFKKSRSYVYTYLKLLDLSADARKSMREHKVQASVAVLVARIPDLKLQLKAMKEVACNAGYTGSGLPMSYIKAAEHIQRNYMLKLDDARFNIKDESLVSAAGACSTCPKRTGHNPDLFADVKSADVCIDPACFHKKEDAHAAAQVATAKAKGQTVIAGKEAQELALPNYGSTKFKGYKRLDSAEDSPTDAPLRKIIGEQMKADGIKPVMIADPAKKGKMVECLPNEVAGRLLKAVEGQAAAAKVVTKEAKELVDEKRLKAEAKAKAQYEKEWRTDLRDDAWVTMRDDASIDAFNTEVHRYLVKQAAHSLSTDDAAALCKVLNLGKVSPVEALIDFAKETNNPAMLHLLIIMQKGCDPHDHSYGGRIPNEGLMLVAGNVFGKELQRTIKDIKAEAMDRIMPKPAKKAPAATAPAARPKEGAGGSKSKAVATKKAPARAAKLSAEEATQGIAYALQGMEGAASAPEGAVALPAKPAGVSKSPAMYRGKNGETWSGRGLKPKWVQVHLDDGGKLEDLLATKTAHASAWPFPLHPNTTPPDGRFAIGQTVRVTTNSDKLRFKHDKYSGKTGTVTGFDVGGKELDVKIGRDTRCFEPGELELVEATA